VQKNSNENTQGNWISGVAQDFDPSNIPETRWCKGKTKTFGMRAIFGQSLAFVLAYLLSKLEQLYMQSFCKYFRLQIPSGSDFKPMQLLISRLKSDERFPT